MARPSKENRIKDLATTIKDAAWDQIRAEGPGALSLRSISRSLGISAPAIYHYFPDRDSLIADLIVEAFTSLGASQAAAAESLPSRPPEARFRALGAAYRNWALAYPQRYLLIFGAPLPGFRMPPEAGFPEVAYALEPLKSVFRDGASGGGGASEGMTVQEEAATRLAFIVWSRVHGLVMLELGGLFETSPTDPEELYLGEIEEMVRRYFEEERKPGRKGRTLPKS
jgi:AcrR family transcriptional regulator